MKVFFDTEFTGLHKRTQLISIGCIAEDGRTFYAENCSFQNGFANQVDAEWINKNVVPYLKFYGQTKTRKTYNNSMITPCPGGQSEVFGELWVIRNTLEHWLEDLGQVELWSDCLSYDFVLLNDLWGHAFKIPKNVYYIPFDICTLFKIKGIDPDINREEFAGMQDGGQKHNALWDAKVIRACYEKLIAT